MQQKNFGRKELFYCNFLLLPQKGNFHRQNVYSYFIAQCPQIKLKTVKSVSTIHQSTLLCGQKVGQKLPKEKVLMANYLIFLSCHRQKTKLVTWFCRWYEMCYKPVTKVLILVASWGQKCREFSKYLSKNRHNLTLGNSEACLQNKERFLGKKSQS